MSWQKSGKSLTTSKGEAGETFYDTIISEILPSSTCIEKKKDKYELGMLKTYHNLSTFEFALSLPFNPVGLGETQTSLDSLWKGDVTCVCAACTGEQKVSWKAGAQPREEYFCRCCTSSITSLPEQHMTQGSLVQALYPQCLPAAFFPSPPWGMKSSGSAGMTSRGDLEMISNCVASAFSHSCCALFLCLLPSQQQPHLLSALRLSSSLSSLLKDAPQVSDPIMPKPH